MERENVKKILKFYNDIEGNIDFARNWLRDFNDKYYGLHSSGGFGGGSKTNRISDPTEAAVLNIPDSARRKADDLTAQIERLYTLQAAIFTEICKLELVEKNIIVFFYIKGFQWVQISSRVHYSETQCKKIRNRALEKLGGFFEGNSTIKNFNYPP